MKTSRFSSAPAFGCGLCGDVLAIHDAVAREAHHRAYAECGPGREYPMGELPKYDEKSALLVVHVQNDFADPNGSLQVERGEQILPLVNHEIDRATGAGAFVVYTRHWHRPSTPHFAIHAGKWPVLCVRDTSGADLQAELKVVGDRIRKALARRTATPASAASTSRAVTGTATASTTCSTQRNRAD